MSLFGKLVRTTINVALLPVALVQDFCTLGRCGEIRDCYTKEQLQKIKDEAED